jgi:hypothetical protein
VARLRVLSGRDELLIGTLQSIVRQSGLPRPLFEVE